MHSARLKKELMDHKKQRAKSKKKKLFKEPGPQKAYEEELHGLMVAHRIAELRKQAHMTQAQLAEQIQSRQQVISRLENESHIPSFSMLRKIARALGAKLKVKLV